MAIEKAKQMWVDPEFAKLIKMKATGEGLTCLKYTKKVADNPNMFMNESKIESMVKQDREKKRRENFGSFF